MECTIQFNDLLQILITFIYRVIEDLSQKIACFSKSKFFIHPIRLSTVSFDVEGWKGCGLWTGNKELTKPGLCLNIPSLTCTIIQDLYVHMHVVVPDSMFASLLSSLLESSLL